MDFSADLSALYADFGQPVTHVPMGGGASVAGLGILDEPGQTLIGDSVIATDYALRYPASSFPAVKRGDTLIVGTTSFTAREAAQPVLDGLEMIVPLAR